jgi:patatin-related protein
MPNSPNAEYTQEVRFAVVMYGGVSLAIYINGVAQELLRMVRSTSASRDDGRGNLTPVPAEELQGTERVYRRLSCLLSDRQLLEQYRDSFVDGKPPANSDLVDKRAAENVVNTRFVVDILSGTSAGGINAIYLAKALVNDQKLDELKKLWVTEGDINLLINDRKSVAGLHLTNQSPPQSLLNSRRMYFKLLNALQGMEKTKKSSLEFVSPHVDELDLFIPTTDIEGLLIPLRLADTVVYERRHRNVFHFKYETPQSTGAEHNRNDFLAKNDPFLAFAARCTSSFPFAFEPMRLCDIDEVLDRFPEYDDRKTRTEALESWKPFFKDNTDPLSGDTIEFGKRSYQDGGALDNKPFTFATETLSRRDAPVAVDRKLIYVEPSPEHPEDEPPRTDKYQALENVKAALLDLPTYETIREDLERLIDRNELIKRVNRITSAIERDFDEWNDRYQNESQWQYPSLKTGEWANLDLAETVATFGLYYLPYRRLRISSTTDELAKLIGRCLNLNVESAQFVAVRHLIQAWRQQMYPDYRQQPREGEKAPEESAEQTTPPPRTANQFLIDFDFKYWLRRLTFMRNKVDQLYGLIRLPVRPDGTVDESKLSLADSSVLRRLARLDVNYAHLSLEDKKKIHEIVTYLKCELRELYKKLRSGGRRIQCKLDDRSSESHKEFVKIIETIKLEQKDIDYLLGLPPAKKAKWDGTSTQRGFSQLDESELTRRATHLLFKPSPSIVFKGQKPKPHPTELGGKIIDAGVQLSKVFHEYVVDEVWDRARSLCDPNVKPPPAAEACPRPDIDTPYFKPIREYLWHYLKHFDDFDQIRFPILFGTEVGESDVVEVIRISPEDATSLIDERAERHKANGRQKLAGTALFHFGAFLDQVWRQNDILWGRLDGAERLITAMLPDLRDEKVRAQLITEAHGAILIEELSEESRAALHLLITDALVNVSAGLTVKEAIARVIRPLRDETLKTRLTSVIRAGLENEKLLEFIKSSYEVNRDLDPKLMLRSIARSTQVIGKMFEDMANQHQLEGKRLAWIARLGQFFWGLVEVAVPGSLLNRLFRHWLKLLYAFELVLIAGSIIFGDKDINSFGWKAFGVTITVNIVVLLLGDYIKGRGRWWRALLLLFGVAVVFLATIGLGELLGRDWAGRIFSVWSMAITWLRTIWGSS